MIQGQFLFIVYDEFITVFNNIKTLYIEKEKDNEREKWLFISE